MIPNAARGAQPTFAAGELNVYARPDEIARVTRALRSTGRRVMLVPTMGALHDGHLALVRAARKVPGAVVVVSIFVNPLQFGAGEDLEAYPRTLDDDLALLRAAGVELVFAPTAAAMYPDGPRTAVHPGPLGSELEGAARPTHFAGMLTVVAKLLSIVRPDRAFFGEKDYQQLVLVRQMVADLDLDVTVVGCRRCVSQTAWRCRRATATSTRRSARPRRRCRRRWPPVSAPHRPGRPRLSTPPARVLSAVPAVDVDYLQVRGVDLGPAPPKGRHGC